MLRNISFVLALALSAAQIAQGAQAKNQSTQAHASTQKATASKAQKQIEDASALLLSFNSGDTSIAQKLLSPHYKQHNQHYKDGAEALISAIPEMKGTQTTIHRAFSDGDYVVLHSEVRLPSGESSVAFDIFRFKNGKIVEHWDNIAAKTSANSSGRTQIDGRASIDSKAKSAESRKIAQDFVNNVLLQGRTKELTRFIGTQYIQHNSAIADGLDGLGTALDSMAKNGVIMRYHKIHKVLASGDFALVVSEGELGRIGEVPEGALAGKSGAPAVAFYDLFRVEKGKIVEHWDIIEPLLSHAENGNGKFGF